MNKNGSKNEQARYEAVGNFRVPEVETAYFARPEKLYRPKDEPINGIKQYVGYPNPKKGYATVNDALAAIKAKLPTT